MATLIGTNVVSIQRDPAPTSLNVQPMSSATSLLSTLGRPQVGPLRYPIVDGTAGQKLTTDGHGNLYWS